MADNRTRRWRAQEAAGAKLFGGRVTPGSGATPYRKGDVRTPDLLIEYKRTDSAQITIKSAWLEKIHGEAILEGRSPVLGIQIGITGRNWVLISEDDYLQLLSDAT